MPLDALENFGFSDLSWVNAASAAGRTQPNRLATSPDFTLTADILSAVDRTVILGFGTFPAGASISGFTITAVDTATKKFTVAGDKRAFFTGITSLEVWASTGNDGPYTVAAMNLVGGATVFTVNEAIPSSTADGTLAQAADSKDFNLDLQLRGPKSWAITGVDTGAKTFTVVGDQRRFLNVGGSIVVSGSTGKDGAYVIAGLALSGGNTVITVTTTIGSAVVDGTLTVTLTLTPVGAVLTVLRQEDRT